MRFDSLEIPQEILAGVADAGYECCSPIQAEVIPGALRGGDVAGQAQTGTGKTAAFLVPLLTRLLLEPPLVKDVPQALIVAPTRELALQIYEEAQVLAGHTGFSLALVIGGMDYDKQAQKLRTAPEIVICTPGRLIDYYKQKIFKTEGIREAVIDEADRLLDLGFAKDMRYILQKLPHYSKRQTMLFSATMTYNVLELTYEYMNLPEFISVTPEDMTVKGVEQILYHVGKEEKLPMLLGLLKREEWSRVLIFVNTKWGVEWVAEKLQGNGFAAEGITGDLPQKKRLQLMEGFRNGTLNILVATDVASRGIHVEDISHVINYDLPQDPENYVHRIGRTARAGKTGKAISLACENYVYHLEPMEKLMGEKVPSGGCPDPEWFVKDKAPHVKRKPRPAAGDRSRGGMGSGGGRSAGRGGPSRTRDRSSSPARGPRPSPAPAPAAEGEGAKKKPRRKRNRGPRPQTGGGGGTASS
ncbi:MAG: DEAD/DEAH box helicase [Proteobacteria bacterium]|nr:DEAD/DEAH box helicase [Pseudomonadota bacterium]